MASILITGASRGIGMATALVLGRAGHTVFATMRNPNNSPLLAQTAAKEGLKIKISAMDVDSDDSVKRAIGEIQKEHGPIDVLVNNAGIERSGSIEELDFSDFRATMETNYFGPVRCIKEVLPQMRKRKSGCIINITSVAGQISCSPLGSYSASKFALEALSESLAQETKDLNIHVAIVQPGIINTDMSRNVANQPRESIYPHKTRLGGLFAASLQNPTSALQVGEKILEIIESGTWQLRHPVGPDAAPFLQWRASMNDQQWVDWGAADDDTWYKSVERDFGLNARPLNQPFNASVESSPIL